MHEIENEDDAKFQDYKDAAWSFMIEHCDIAKDTGALFVKFHTDSRANFEGRINARRAGYHRENWIKKQQQHERKLKQKEIKKEIARVTRLNTRKSWWRILKAKFKSLL